MVEAARRAYRDYPTVVNALEESGVTYKNEMSGYAKMDSIMQGAQKAIGGSSDSAQLALSYYWSMLYNKQENDFEAKQLYENINVLATLAQCAIDGCKRSYAVNPNEEIKRIRGQACMNRKKDYPKFMKYTREIAMMKNNVERPYEEIENERKRIKRRIDPDIVCPMNWLEEALDQIQGIQRVRRYTAIDDIFVWEKGVANSRKMGKVRTLVEQYDRWVTANIYNIAIGSSDTYEEMIRRSNEIVEKIRGINLSYVTINHLVGAALKADSCVSGKSKSKEITKISRKLLNILYRTNRDYFLQCFRVKD